MYCVAKLVYIKQKPFKVFKTLIKSLKSTHLINKNQKLRYLTQSMDIVNQPQFQTEEEQQNYLNEFLEY